MIIDNTIKKLQKEIEQKDRIIKNLYKTFNPNITFFNIYLHEERHLISRLSADLSSLFRKSANNKINNRLIEDITQTVETIRSMHSSLGNAISKYTKQQKEYLFDFVKEFQKTIELLIKGQNITFKITIDPHSQNILVSNKLFIFSNIISNSIRALQDVKQDKKNIILRISTDSSNTIFNFYDNGIGIPEENKNNIWEPFYSTWRNASGLGLNIVKNFVEDLGGDIYISSKYQEYTNVKVILPYRINKDEENTMDR